MKRGSEFEFNIRFAPGLLAVCGWENLKLGPEDSRYSSKIFNKDQEPTLLLQRKVYSSAVPNNKIHTSSAARAAGAARRDFR